VVAGGDRRAQIHAVVSYLRRLRAVVQAGATEHSRWVRFIGTTASVLRTAPRLTDSTDVTTALGYAERFGKLRRHLSGLTPPITCMPLQDAATSWLEALDLLSSAVPPALERKSPKEMDALVREASEAQIRIRTVQRVHEKTVAAMNVMFRSRPTVPRRAPRPAKPVARKPAAPEIRS
jgi:hypothetical protein